MFCFAFKVFFTQANKGGAQILSKISFCSFGEY